LNTTVFPVREVKRRDNSPHAIRLHGADASLSGDIGQWNGETLLPLIDGAVVPEHLDRFIHLSESLKSVFSRLIGHESGKGEALLLDDVRDGANDPHAFFPVSLTPRGKRLRRLSDRGPGLGLPAFLKRADDEIGIDRGACLKILDSCDAPAADIHGVMLPKLSSHRFQRLFVAALNVFVVAKRSVRELLLFCHSRVLLSVLLERLTLLHPRFVRLYNMLSVKNWRVLSLDVR
jgi:hypothetical protein